MSLFDDVTDPAFPAPVRNPCAACAEEAPYEVWGVRLCPSCFDSLQAVESYMARDWGVSDADFPAEATRRTRAWVEAQRAQPRQVANG